MSVCGLLSGGKDSIFNLLQCQNIGLKIEVLATLYPPSGGNMIYLFDFYK